MQDSAPEPAVKLIREELPILQPLPRQAVPKAGHSIHVWGARDGAALSAPLLVQVRLQGLDPGAQTHRYHQNHGVGRVPKQGVLGPWGRLQCRVIC